MRTLVCAEVLQSQCALIGRGVSVLTLTPTYRMDWLCVCMFLCVSVCACVRVRTRCIPGNLRFPPPQKLMKSVCFCVCLYVPECVRVCARLRNPGEW